MRCSESTTRCPGRRPGPTPTPTRSGTWRGSRRWRWRRSAKSRWRASSSAGIEPCGPSWAGMRTTAREQRRPAAAGAARAALPGRPGLAAFAADSDGDAALQLGPTAGRPGRACTRKRSSCCWAAGSVPARCGVPTASWWWSRASPRPWASAKTRIRAGAGGVGVRGARAPTPADWTRRWRRPTSREGEVLVAFKPLLGERGTGYTAGLPEGPGRPADRPPTRESTPSPTVPSRSTWPPATWRTEPDFAAAAARAGVADPAWWREVFLLGVGQEAAGRPGGGRQRDQHAGARRTRRQEPKITDRTGGSPRWPGRRWWSCGCGEKARASRTTRRC